MASSSLNRKAKINFPLIYTTLWFWLTILQKTWAIQCKCFCIFLLLSHHKCICAFSNPICIFNEFLPMESYDILKQIFHTEIWCSASKKSDKTFHPCRYFHLWWKNKSWVNGMFIWNNHNHNHTHFQIVQKWWMYEIMCKTIHHDHRPRQ